MRAVIVVGAAVMSEGKLLAVRRTEPPALAGLWEFPGGKVEPGETERGALARECLEELGLVLEIGERVGPDTAVPAGTLKVYAARAVGGELALTEHDAYRWLSAGELDDVPWIPADAPVVAAVRALLVGEERADRR